MLGEVRITTPADPEKVKAYRKTKAYKKSPHQRVDKMGRKIGEKVKMTEERANEILDKRQSAYFRSIFRED